MSAAPTKKISQYDIIMEDNDDSIIEFMTKKYEALSKQIDERLRQIKIKKSKDIKN